MRFKCLCQLHLCPEYPGFFLLFRVDNRHSMLFQCLQTANLNVCYLCHHPKWTQSLPGFPPVVIFSTDTVFCGRQGTKCSEYMEKELSSVHSKPFQGGHDHGSREGFHLSLPFCLLFGYKRVVECRWLFFLLSSYVFLRKPQAILFCPLWGMSSPVTHTG